MNVDKGTDTVSMVRMRVKIASLILIFADSAGTKLPICAKYTINPTLNERQSKIKSSQKNVYENYETL